jgi:hypothetical protein
VASAHFAVRRGAPLVQLPLSSELVGAPEKKRVPTVTAAVIRQVTLAPEKNTVKFFKQCNGLERGRIRFGSRCYYVSGSGSRKTQIAKKERNKIFYV